MYLDINSDPPLDIYGQLSLPSARNRGITEFTTPIFDIKLNQKITLSLYERLLAVVAVGVTSFMPRDIPQVHITNPFL
jgi:hypothetical protein